MQHLQDEVITPQVLNLFGFSAISRSHRVFLCPNSIIYLFVSFTIVLSNAIVLRSSYGLIQLFSKSSENSGPVIINAIRYAIAKFSSAFFPKLDLNLVQRKTLVHIVWGMLLAYSS